jgi:hypothetical protein
MKTMASRLPTKKLLTAMMGRLCEAFSFLPALKPGYWFRRGPLALFHDFVVIESSQKEQCFSIDVAISAFPIWDKSYGYSPLRYAAGLQNLRLVLRHTTILG